MRTTLGLGWILARVKGVGFSTHCILLDATASAIGSADLSTYNHSHRPGQAESASIPMLYVAVRFGFVGLLKFVGQVLRESSSDVLSPTSKQNHKHNDLFSKTSAIRANLIYEAHIGEIAIQVKVDTSVDAMTEFPILFDS